MIVGRVSLERTPTISIEVGEDVYNAVIDTGFNGDLELPDELRNVLDAYPLGKRLAFLGAGQEVEEEIYLVEFPFDGRTLGAEASFVTGTDEILIGTGLLEQYLFEINFPDSIVRLERLADRDSAAPAS